MVAPLTFRLSPGGAKLVLARGDLTKFGGCAIVNAANERMLGGGGVDGAIHRAAGPALKAACRAVPEVAPGVRCPTGEARLTIGGDLTARFVIHTVGPIYKSPERSAPLLESAYRSSLQLANEHQLKSVAFPAISCGVYGYPHAEAAEIAVKACQEGAGSLQVIHFSLFEAKAMHAWTAAARAAGLTEEEAAEEPAAAAEAAEEESSGGSRASEKEEL